MREIKFRAWDKDIKTMIYQESSNIENAIQFDVSIVVGFDNLACMLKEDEHGNKLFINTGELIPMQFTGLKDKNGKEGYHKDIVRSGKKLYTIEWQDEEARFWIAPRAGDSWHFMDMLSSFEIIGNVFENPELINTTPSIK